MRNDIKTRFRKGHSHGFKKGHKPWNTGISRSEETKKKLSEKAKLQWKEGRVGIFPIGENKWNWKGGISKPGVRQKIKEEQAGRPKPKNCEICNGVGKIHFDHDHETGNFRGWICTQCNCALGMLKDSPDRLLKLIDYLKKHGK